MHSVALCSIFMFFLDTSDLVVLALQSPFKLISHFPLSNLICQVAWLIAMTKDPVSCTVLTFLLESKKAIFFNVCIFY